jgi:hypothetical protein
MRNLKLDVFLKNGLQTFQVFGIWKVFLFWVLRMCQQKKGDRIVLEHDGVERHCNVSRGYWRLYPEFAIKYSVGSQKNPDQYDNFVVIWVMPFDGLDLILGHLKQTLFWDFAQLIQKKPAI